MDGDLNLFGKYERTTERRKWGLWEVNIWRTVFINIIKIKVW